MLHAPYSYHMHLLFVRVANKGQWLPTQNPQDPEQSPAGKAPIYLRITLSGRAQVSTGVEATAAEWNVKSHRLRGKNADVKQANDILLDWERRAVDEYGKLKSLKPSARRIKEALVGAERSAPLRLIDLFSKFCEHRARPELKLSISTREFYDAAFTRLRGYLLTKKCKNMLAHEVDLQWLRQYEEYCLQVRKMKVVTMKRHLGVLCMVFRFGAHKGLLSVNPALGYQSEAQSEEKSIDFLTSEELQRIATTPYRKPRMQRLADAFLFLCYTGLSNVDYLRFKPEEHIHISHGREWIRMKRQKSDKAFSARLIEPAKELLTKYKMKLPRIINDVFNDGLKKLGALVGITRRITTGIARHTFSQQLRDRGYSDESTAAQAGHTVEVMNQHYSRISEARIAQEEDRLRGTQPGLLDQLRIALQDPAQAALIRQMLGGASI